MWDVWEGGGLCIPIYMFIYVCARVCVYTHALLPLFSVAGKRLWLRLPPWVRSFKSKEPAWLLFNRYSTVLLNSECSSERDEQGTRKLFPAAWAPRQQILQTMLFPQGLRFNWQARRGTWEHIFWHLRTSGWVGHRAWVEGLWATSGAEQRGGVTHYRRASLWEYQRTPWSSGNQRRVGMKQNCLLLRGCFAILDEDLLGAGLLSCQENEAVILYPVFIAVPQGWLYFLIRHRDLKLQRLR